MCKTEGDMLLHKQTSALSQKRKSYVKTSSQGYLLHTVFVLTIVIKFYRWKNSKQFVYAAEEFLNIAERANAIL